MFPSETPASQSDVNVAAVRSQLDAILASRPFANADRLRRFLRFVTEKTLAGEVEQVKETVIGIEVFGRRADTYDPGTDSVVRVQARRLRGKLEEYYGVDGAADLLVIELPRGSYVPSFRLRELSGPARRGAPNEATGARRDNSIAVLPFVNVSPDPDNEYFSDGLTEELIHALGTVPSLKVAARSSSFQFKGKHLDVREIGTLLDVGKIIEGSVRKAGDRLRITVQIVSAADGSQLWSERFDGAATDVFALQDEIAESIRRALSGHLSEGTRQHQARHSGASHHAFDHYLKGRFHWNKRSERGLRDAIAHFNEAIRIDRAYGRAYSGLADCYLMLGMSGADAPAECMPRAREAAQQALAIDDRLVEAHTSLAAVLANYDWDRGAAVREFRRALELDPSYPTLRQWYGLFLLAPERRFDEATEQIHRAEDLDPVSLPIALDRALVQIFAGHYEDALGQCSKVLALDASYHRAYWFLGLVRERMGDIAGAIDALEKALALDVALDSGTAFRSRIRGALGRCLARGGKTDRARALLGEMESSAPATYTDQFELAQIHIGLGDAERAVACLERGAREHSSFLIFANVWPGFETLRATPGFGEILARLSVNPARGSGLN